MRVAKRSGRRFVGGLVAILAVVCGYGIFLLNSVEPPRLPLPASIHVPFAKNIQVAWPSGVHAAVGTVEDGLLAQSSARETPRSTASMAKVITALAILQKLPLDVGESGPTYTMTAHDVAVYRAYQEQNGSVLPVYEGMMLTEYQALQAMLITSADNIADTLAERVFGSPDNYIAYAQKMVQTMGLSQTEIADASGYDANTVSTPAELIALGIAVLKNPVMAQIVAQPTAQIPGVGIIKNTNELLGTNGVVGIKTGTTDSAGKCLLFASHYYSTKEHKEITIVGVIMGDTNAANLFHDSTALLASTEQDL